VSPLVKPFLMQSFFADSGTEGLAYLHRDGVPVVKFLGDAAAI
jgi:hypothetical protein